jgi:H/ACA ribonucleoprotein complex subunit 4
MIWGRSSDVADARHYASEGNDRYLLRVLQPVEAAVAHLARIWVMDTTVDTVCHGASLKVPGISKVESGIAPGDTVAILTLKDELVGVGKAALSSDHMQRDDRGIAVRTEKVFMLPDTYPRMDKSPEVGR